MKMQLNNSLNSTTNEFRIDFFLMSLKILIVLMATLLNGILVYVYLFCITKKTFSDSLFFSIAVADLTIGLVAMSSQALIDSYFSWPFGKVSCTLFVFIQYAVPDVTAYTLLALSIHRLMQIFSPFKARENLNLINFFKLFIPWLFTFALWAILIFFLIFNDQFDFVSCEIDASWYLIIYKEMFVNVLTILLILATNIFLIYLLKAKKKFKTNGQSNRNKSIFYLDPSQSNQNHIKKKGQNFLAQNKEKKATYCVMALMLSVLCTQISYVAIWPLYESHSVLSEWLDIFYRVSMWLSYCTCITDPIIQLIFNEKIKIILKNKFLNGRPFHL